ncbi:hypothetical protein ABKV51_23270 [Enterobacter hormaechei]
MSELTKEWLLKTIAELEEERDAIPGAVNEDAAMELEAMKLAMASLEAEAVAYVSQSNLDALKRGHNDVFVKRTDDVARPVALYTATPAPVVPDAIEMDDDFDSAFEHGKAVGWNACRAAMLQGKADQAPVKQPSSNSIVGWLRADYRYDNRGLRGNAPLFVLGKKDPSSVWGLDYIPLTGNSPVIPDGWVLVPVEPTHEMLEAGDEQFGTYDVYRRMIEAAPQQEVK